ncbi:hypothetical protein SNE40_012504 [Patella caerulea]|uniref:Transient receptor potential cation channel subfamily M member 2 n=1 Tax=Patella caerulea TaxID=87958 RepID=A0AAN8PND0_PATCE
MASPSDNIEMAKVTPDKTMRIDQDNGTNRFRNSNPVMPMPKTSLSAMASLSADQQEEINWIQRNVKIKRCCGFVKAPGDKNNVADPKCKCGQIRSLHPSDSMLPPNNEDVPWKVEEYPCDAFGEIEFHDSDNQVAKFIRVSNDQGVTKILKELLMKKWKLQKPNLLISVTGGAKNFDMKSRLREVFRRGLQKAAESTGAWIVTGGTNTGVMKHVGEAMKEISITDERNRVVAIGVAPWGCIQNRENLISPDGKWPCEYNLLEDAPKPDEVFLNPNHTHFLLVDDGTTHKWATEIDFRSALEKAISEMSLEMSQGTEVNKTNIPVVLLVLQGGPGTFKTILGAIKNKTPTVVIKGTGGAADILALAFQRAQSTEISGFDRDREQIRNTVMGIDANLQDELFKLMEQNYGNTISKSEYMEIIKEIIQSKDLLTVFELDSRNSTNDVDMAILKALLKDNRNDVMDQLELALVWDKMEVAKKEILGDDNLDKKNLRLPEKMLTAIQRNRVSFVDLFIDHGVNLKQFLTRDRLLTLYNTIPENCILRNLLRLKASQKRQKLQSITFLHVNSLLQDLLGDYFVPYYDRPPYHHDNKSDVSSALASASDIPQAVGSSIQRKLDHPIQDLFIWSILMNRQELAKLFWVELDEPIAAALFANGLYKGLKMISVDTEISQILQQNADEFENLAIGVLNSCYEKDENKAQDLLIRELPNWGETTCVLMAVQSDNKRFISQTACQTLLNSIWMGKLSSHNSILRILPSIVLFPLIFFLVKFKDDENRHNSEMKIGDTEYDPSKSQIDDKRNQNQPRTSNCSKLKQFYLAPAVIFYLNVFTYLVFLCLYSYHILISFNRQFTIIEGIICGWVVTIFVEEMRQVYTSNARSLGSKVKAYFTDSWNILDLVTVFLFALGIILRFIPNDITFEFARVTLCLNLVSFYFRILHIFSVNKQLGPKLVMIRRMVQDLMSFVVILAVFIMAYAVATEAILYPNTELSWKMIYHVPRKAYWQIYGELFLEDIEGENPCSSDPAVYGDYETLRCPSEVGKYLAPVFMGIYVLMTNVLLLNLLIAMFSYTFQKIQDNTDLHWYFQRYQLVHEYYSRPFLPPPAIIIVHVYLFIKYLKGKCFITTKKGSDFRKKYDSKQEERQIVQWENVIAENYCNANKRDSVDSLHQRYVTILERLENMSSKAVEYQDGEQQSSPLDNRVQLVEQQMASTYKALDWIMSSLSENKLAAKTPRPQLCDAEKFLEKELRRKRKKELRNAQLRHFFTDNFKLHVACRNSKYCDTGIQRTQLNDEEVLWAIKVPFYNPPKYTNPKILANTKPYADTVDLLEVSLEESQKFQFNAYDENFKCDRRSLCGHDYEVKDGVPLNPRGRTGLIGRGDLGRWGPNYTIDCVVSRWKKDEDGQVDEEDGRPLLEFIAIRRSDSSKQWAIPGGFPIEGFASPQIDMYDSLIKVFADEALGYLTKSVEEKKTIEELLHRLAAKGQVIFEGYADDRRNTDNAWTESRLINFHDDDGSIVDNLRIMAGDKSVDMAAWIVPKSSIPFWGNHADFLSLIAEKYKAFF